MKAKQPVFNIATDTRGGFDRRTNTSTSHIVSKVLMDGSCIAEFSGATAPRQAEEAMKMAKDQHSRGIPVQRLTKCVADGASLRTVCKTNDYKQEGLFVG